MTYLMCDSKRRILPVVTFVLISYLFSGEFVCARPQDSSLSVPPHSNDTKDIVAEKVEPVNNSTLNDRYVQPTVIEQSIKIFASPSNASSSTEPKKAEQKIYGDMSVDSGLDFGRAAIESSTKHAPTVNTLKPFTKQGVTPITASDMVVADVRTPPKVKSQIVHSHMQSLMSPGKGEAIPVVLEGNDEAALEKISSDNFKYTHSDATPSSGLSTWILLNSDSVSTPLSHHKKTPKPAVSETPNVTSSESPVDSKKRTAKPSTASATTITSTTTTEKMVKSKIEAVVMKKPDRKPIATIQKVNQTYAKKPSTPKIEPDEISTTTIVSLQDSKFRNKTPVVVGKVPSTNSKDVVNTTTPMSFVELPFDNGTRLGTPVVTFPHVPVKQKNNSSTTRKPSTTQSKPSMVMISSGAPTKFASVQEYSMTTTVATASPEMLPVMITEEISLEPVVETTTKKSSSSKKKKKKNKNKNKRKRPSKKPAKIQSKISEDDNSTSAKLPTGMPNGSRPLSTRIYNYLAREVMPNVGVGIVGLMLTAGLAGLLLYPFGGAVPIRRNYEKPHPSYNLNDYPPIGEVDNAQPEESVLSQVLAGMSNTMNQYSREQPDVSYKLHPKYKPARYDNPNTYNHHKDVKYTTETPVEDSKYSELGDVVSGPHESVKFTSFDINDSIKYPMDNAQPSPSYSTIDLTTSSQNEPVYHKYNPSKDSNKHDSPVYSTLGEYSSYNSPHEPMQNPVYNGESYDYKNHKNNQDVQEFKVNSELEVVTQAPENLTTTTKIKHEQPSFAALEGIPKNYRTLQTSIRFEDTASVLPMNQDFVPSDGIYAASIEHGPRNMKLRRRKRNVSSENEIDSVLIDNTEKLPSSTQSPVQFITTESDSKGVTGTTLDNNIVEEVKSTPITQNHTEDYKILNSTTTTEINSQFFDSKNKSGPILVTPEPSSAESSSISNPKVEIIPHNTNDEDCDLSSVEEHPPAPKPFSISNLFRKLLDFKFRIGFELIRATTDVISKYLSTVQQRMTEALRDLQRSAFRMNTAEKKSRINVIKKRERRHIIYGS